MRYELPDDISPEDARAVIDALERYLRSVSPPVSAWAVAGRAENLGLGALQARHRAPASAWGRSAGRSFTRRVTEQRLGRGDSR